MIKEKLEKLDVPSALEFMGKRAETVDEWENDIRPEIEKFILESEYGYIPDAPESVEYKIKNIDERFCAGKATFIELDITSTVYGEKFTFPVNYVYPSNGNKFKTFLHINFRPFVPDKYMPTEEIIDNGFACASFCYQDVTSDDGDFTNGLAGLVYKNSERTETSPGKIAMWAWAAMRVMDYLQTREEVDKDNICVCGHSRLGKTALLTGAIDKRFAAVHSNCAGCSGDALNRGKLPKSEHIGDILDRFEFWFCKNYENFRNKDDETPFEQHFLHALIAPRRVHVASAENDIWAGPETQILCCAAASDVYELYGKKGFVCGEENFLKTGKYLNDGSIGFCYRSGNHYFSRDDWHGLFDFMNK